MPNIGSFSFVLESVKFSNILRFNLENVDLVNYQCIEPNATYLFQAHGRRQKELYFHFNLNLKYSYHLVNKYKLLHGDWNTMRHFEVQ